MKKVGISFLLLFLVTGFVVFSGGTAFAGTPTTASALMKILKLITPDDRLVEYTYNGNGQGLENALIIKTSTITTTVGM